jgi:hypothetical protein
MERGRTLRPYPNSVQCLADALRLSMPEREQLGRAARSALTEVGQAPLRDGPADDLALLARALVAIAGTGGTITVSSRAAEESGRPALSLRWVLGPVDALADGQLRISLTGSPGPVSPASLSTAVTEPG